MHSFLAVMGGFVVEMKDQPGNDDKAEIQSFLPLKSTGTRRTRLTLVPEALRFFKEKGLNSLIPEPSLVHIQDKSKGNTLAKALVCLQGKCTIPSEQRLIVIGMTANNIIPCGSIVVLRPMLHPVCPGPGDKPAGTEHLRTCSVHIDHIRLVVE